MTWLHCYRPVRSVPTALRSARDPFGPDRNGAPSGLELDKLCFAEEKEKRRNEIRRWRDKKREREREKDERKRRKRFNTGVMWSSRE